MGGMHVGLPPTDDLQHQPNQRGEQDLACVLLLARRLEPLVKPFGVEKALKQSAHHHAGRGTLGKALQDTVKHQGVSSRVARR
ncbi:MAG: hypothetical protein C1943_09560 [Halochromatium sp.]|nr:hypothetical protein [Halochromatium sp.]